MWNTFQITDTWESKQRFKTRLCRSEVFAGHCHALLVQKRAGQSFVWCVGKRAEWKRTPDQKIVAAEVQACYQVLNEKQPGWYSNPLNILMLVKQQLSCYHLGVHTLKASLSGLSQTLGTRGCCSQSRRILGQQTLMRMVVSKGAFLYRHSAVFDEPTLLSSRSFHFRPNSCKPVRTDQPLRFHGSPCSFSRGEIRRVRVYKGHAAALLMSWTVRHLQWMWRDPQKDFVKGFSI